MHVSGISPGPFQALGAGVRAQAKAEVMASALASAGLLNDSLATSLETLAVESENLTAAGVEAAQLEMVGTMIDALA